MPSDAPSRPVTRRGEDPRGLARELVSEAAADYGRVRKAMLRRVAPEGIGASASAAHEMLHAAVVDYAKILRATGAPPEGVLVEVQSAVDAALRLDELERRACVGSAVRWATEAYYGA
jgi:hypothetical protein